MALPYMPFFCDAYMLDAGHLSEEEHGAYLRLLILAWSSPECRLPNDDAWLARRLARPLNSIERLYRPIIAEFFQTSGNWVWQKRQRAEWEHARERAKKQSDNAKSRWSKKNPSCDGNAMAMPTKPNQTKEQKEAPNGASKEYGADAPAPAQPAGVRKRVAYPSGFEAVWSAYPRRDEDGKADCAKHYRAAVAAGADEAAILAGAVAWQAVAEDDFRVGLRNWLRNGRWAQPPPPPRKPAPQPYGDPVAAYHANMADYAKAADLFGEDEPDDDDQQQHRALPSLSHQPALGGQTGAPAAGSDPGPGQALCVVHGPARPEGGQVSVHGLGNRALGLPGVGRVASPRPRESAVAGGPRPSGASLTTWP